MTTELVRSSLERLFDLSRHGLLWLDPLSRVVGRNEVAASILEQNDGVRLRDPRLVFSRNGVGRELDAFIARMHRSQHDRMSGPEASFVRRIERPSGRVPYLLFATPCITHGGFVGVLVLLDDLGESPDLCPGVCQSVYGLTPAEARVAMRLVDGRSAPGIAQDLGLSPLTVRTHIKRVFKKVGVRSQPQLMAALCRIAFLPVGTRSRGVIRALGVRAATGWALACCLVAESRVWSLCKCTAAGALSLT